MQSSQPETTGCPNRISVPLSRNGRCFEGLLHGADRAALSSPVLSYLYGTDLEGRAPSRPCPSALHTGCPNRISVPLSRNGRCFEGLLHGADRAAPSSPVLSYLCGTDLEGRAPSRPYPSVLHTGCPNRISVPLSRNGRCFEGLLHDADRAAPSSPVLSYLYGTDLEGRAPSRPCPSVLHTGCPNRISVPLSRNGRCFEGLLHGADRAAPSSPVLSYLHGTGLEGRAPSRPCPSVLHTGCPNRISVPPVPEWTMLRGPSARRRQSGALQTRPLVSLWNGLAKGPDGLHGVCVPAFALVSSSEGGGPAAMPASRRMDSISRSAIQAGRFCQTS